MQEKTWGDYKDFLINGLDEAKQSVFADRAAAIFIPIFKSYIESRTSEFLEEIYGKDTIQLIQKNTK